MQKVTTYLREVRAEFSRVVWPTRRQAVTMTITVIGFSLVVAAFVGGIDYLFTQLLEQVVEKR